MKRNFFIGSLLMFTLLGASLALADVLPPHSHPLERCVKVVNIDEFKDMHFIGYILEITGGHSAYIIEKNKCLSMGYKFNQLKILAAKKSYIKSIGLDHITPTDKNVFTSDIKIEPYGGFVDQDNPLIEEEIEYSVAGFYKGKVILYKSKHKKIETFSKPII